MQVAHGEKGVVVLVVQRDLFARQGSGVLVGTIADGLFALGHGFRCLRVGLGAVRGQGDGGLLGLCGVTRVVVGIGLVENQLSFALSDFRWVQAESVRVDDFDLDDE